MTAIDDPDLFLIWMNTLTRPEPDVARLASLEDMAAERGWSMTAALDALVARLPGANPSAIRNAVRDWSPDLHPRGNDGKFISTGGGVKLSGRGPNGVKLDGLRGVVQGIDPDPKTPGRPNIRVGLFDPKKPGRPARTISVKPEQITEDASKARLDTPATPSPKIPAAQKKMAAFDPNGDHIAQFTGGNPLAPNGNDDFGREASKGLSDDELDQVIALRQQDVADKVGLSPAADLKILQAEKARRGTPVAPSAQKKMAAFDPDGDRIAQFEGGNPLAPNGNDDFGKAAASQLTDDELTQVIGMREQDVANKVGLSPSVDLKVLQAEQRRRGGGAPSAPKTPAAPAAKAPAGPSTKRPGAFDPAGDHVAQFEGGNPLSPDGNDDFGKAAVSQLTDDELGQVISMREKDVVDNRGLSPSVDLKVLQAEQRRRGTGGAPSPASPTPAAKPAGRGAPKLPKGALPDQDVAPRQVQPIDAQRAALTKKVNDQAASLSTTDADARAAGLEEIFKNLRFSIIDTNQVHDMITPPDDESGKWTAERHAQHEEMWQNLLSQVEAAGIPKDRDALVLGGLPGAGKTYALKPGQKADGFGVTSWEPTEPVPEGGATHVSINPDIIKEMLIARGMVPDGLDNLKPMEKVNFIHEESSMLGKMFSARLAAEGYNIVLDNTMDSESAMLKRMTPLAEKDYKFRALFVDIPVEESLISASKRYKDAALTPQGGRYVPSSVQANRKSTKGTLSKNRDAMDGLVGKDWFTSYMIIDNSGISDRTPLGEITGQGTGEGSAATAYARAAAEKLAGAAPATAPATLAPV